MPDTPVRCEGAIAFLKSDVGPDDRAILQLEHDQSPVLRQLGNGLLVGYVVDQGTSFEFITNGHLAAQGFSSDQLHEVGLANLAKAVHSRGVKVYPNGSTFAVIAGGNFEASLILLEDLWEEGLRQFTNARYAVAVPARDVLAFGDPDDPVALSQLRDIIDRVWPDGDHLLCNRLFTRTCGVWSFLGD